MDFFNLAPTLHGSDLSDAIAEPHSTPFVQDHSLFNVFGDDSLVSTHPNLDDFFGDALNMTPVHADGALRRHHHHMRGNVVDHDGPVLSVGKQAIVGDNGEATTIVAQEVVKGPNHAEIIITYKMPKRHAHRVPAHSPHHGHPHDGPASPPSVSNVPIHPLPRQRMPPPAHYMQPPPDIISAFSRPDPPLTTMGIIGGILTIGAQFYLWGHVFTTCFKRPAGHVQAMETSPEPDIPPRAETTIDNTREHEENEKNDAAAASITD